MYSAESGNLKEANGAGAASTNTSSKTLEEEEEDLHNFLDDLSRHDSTNCFAVLPSQKIFDSGNNTSAVVSEGSNVAMVKSEYSQKPPLLVRQARSGERIIRDNRYFAEAARRSRKKRKQEMDHWKRRTTCLEEETQALEGKVFGLQNLLKSLAKLPPREISFRNDRLLKFENEALREEVNRHRQLASNLKSFLLSIEAKSIKNDFVLLRTRLSNNTAQELLEICYASVHARNWAQIEPDNNIHVSGPFSRYQLDSRRSISQGYMFRQDAVGIPIEFDVMCKIIDEVSKPENYSLVSDCGSEPNKVRKNKVKFSTDLIESNYLDGQIQSCGRSDILRFCETIEAAGHLEEEYIVRSTSNQVVDREIFPFSFPEPASDVTNKLVVKVHMISALPEAARKLLCGEVAVPENFVANEFLHGVVISRGKGGTTNVAFISRLLSWTVVKQRMKIYCNLPKAMVTESTYASFASEFANAVLGVYLRYGRLWKFFN